MNGAPPNDRSASSPAGVWFVRAAALGVLLLGVAVLAGWGWNITGLKNLTPDTVSMKPNTALGLALAGAALLLLAPPPVAPWSRRAGTAFAGLGALLGALTLGEYFFGWQLGIDELLFHDDPAAVATLIPGRMAPSTAGCFVLFGLALAGLGWEPRRGFHLAEFLAFLVGIASLGSLAEYFVGQPMLYQFSAYTRMAPHTALGFILLSAGVSLARPARGVLGWLRASGAGREERAAYGVLVLGLLAVLGAGSWFYHAQEEQMRHRIEDDLQSVAVLKADQIARWRATSLQDAARLTENPFLVESVARWLAAPQTESAEEINAYLHSLETHAGYSDIVLVDSRGQERLLPSDRLEALDEAELQALALALREQRPVLGDLQPTTADRPAHLDLIAPLFRRSGATVQPLGAIIMEIEAQRFLYPLIKSWPVPSRSAESFLVRREGNNVLFLNEARHQKDTAFKLRIPGHRREVPAVAAVFYDREGVFAGFDYRGVKVLSVVQPIPDTPWFLVAKVDEAEAFAGWRDQAKLIVALVVTLVLALAATVRTIGLQRARYRELSRSETALRKINRAYQVLSEGNQALVRAESEPLLLRTICQVLTEQGGYRLAWVGLAEEDEARSVRPVAHAGFEAGYLERLQITWADTARGRGPAGTAIRTGRPSVAQDILHDPHFAPWRADALQRGYAAVVGLPLTGSGRAFGVLCVYAAEARAFDEQELHLLAELAGDLAFGLTTLRLRIERQQAEQRLQLQGAALQAAANGIVITDRAGTIEWVNPAFATLTGFTAAEAIGRNPRDLVKSDRHDAAFYQNLWTTILAGQVWQGEIINRRKDGSCYTEFQTITPVRDARGEISHFIGIKEDVTVRKTAAVRLHAQAEIIDQAPVAIVITDLAHRVTYCNAGAQRLYGLTEAQLLGHTADELFSEETIAALEPGRTTTLATGSWRGEVPVSTRDGRHFVAEFIMSLISDEAGQPIARLSIALDVTEKKQMGEQVKRMQRLENLGMLAAGIAHDMNNILAPIVMAVPLLKPRVPDVRGQSILATMEKSGERGAALVRQLLAFAHGASGEFKLIQVRHVLKDIAEMVAASFPKSLRLATDLPGALWPVTGNASQLHQVFLNLCINARDAMPGGGTLHLEAANRRLTAEEARAISDARPGAFLAVTVADTGTGIPPDTLARIWDPFFTTKTPDKGTGLGLSTVRGIVAQHQGFIALQTHVGQGTTFTVYLPADEAAVRGEDRPASATPLPRGDGELVLVVDDEPPVREMTAHILTHYGYRVLSAGDGAEALALFATHAQEVQLVVTDLQMPLLDGKNLVTALLRLRSGLPVICMSGADTVSKSLTPFLSAFLVKPFTVEALVETVHAALHRPTGNTAANP